MNNGKSRNKKVNELENSLIATQQENKDLKVLIEQLKNQVRFDERVFKSKMHTVESDIKRLGAEHTHMLTLFKSAQLIIENSKQQNATTDALLSIISNFIDWYARKGDRR